MACGSISDIMTEVCRRNKTLVSCDVISECHRKLLNHFPAYTRKYSILMQHSLLHTFCLSCLHVEGRGIEWMLTV